MPKTCPRLCLAVAALSIFKWLRSQSGPAPPPELLGDAVGEMVWPIPGANEGDGDQGMPTRQPQRMSFYTRLNS